MGQTCGYPVSRGHLLVMLFRHTLDFFSMTPEEMVALISLIDACKDVIETEFSPAGYNIGFNVGEAAGQTVMHCHCHVIPRYVGGCAGCTRGSEGGCAGAGRISPALNGRTYQVPDIIWI
ncbi:MAG: HIT family protein [Methanoregula sp.]|nr:HIT family protein [Methanoregula sp.]